MQQIIGSLSGYSIVLAFTIITLYVFMKRETKEHNFTHYTISGFSAAPSLRPKMIAGCIIASLLIFPFLYGLALKFDLLTNPLLMILGFMSSVLLILTALTVYDPYSFIHNFVSISLYLSILVIEILVSIQAFHLYPMLGMAGLGVIGINSILTPGVFLYNKFKLNGVLEISYLSLACLWLVIFSSALIV